MANIAKHTPGPWSIIPRSYTIDRRSIEGFHINSDGTGIIITQLIPGKTTDRVTEVCKANACLIAAAPEMYEALKLAISKDQLTGEARDVAIAAISKAEGK